MSYRLPLGLLCIACFVCLDLLASTCITTVVDSRYWFLIILFLCFNPHFRSTTTEHGHRTNEHTETHRDTHGRASGRLDAEDDTWETHTHTQLVRHNKTTRDDGSGETHGMTVRAPPSSSEYHTTVETTRYSTTTAREET
ncbi:hypothetical protein QBC41DRAFT_52556 [Cercophora samala]|uniref:Uncharacterized protein n=1 Tax=Cercophora samala TaxID=330535 RepID=A0AA40DEN2_9PEZI|nr:hypothetical protein QBC41DRAFT_52556 [Cercophora samala]